MRYTEVHSNIHWDFYHQYEKAGTKVLASQLSLDCRGKTQWLVGSTTLIFQHGRGLLNYAEGNGEIEVTGYTVLSFY